MARTASTGTGERAASDSGTHPALSAPQLLDALRGAASVLEQHAAALDGLGTDRVWSPELTDGSAEGTPAPTRPGPGSDLATTLGAACDSASSAGDFSMLSRGLAAGASDAARTAAGRRLAEFLGGMGDAMRNADRLDAARLALAMESGAERVTESDDGAHPGCLVSVMSAAADGALGASDDGADMLEVLVSAAEAGLVELERGPTTDQRLAERGAVDAAAAGFLLVLDSVAAVLGGDPLPEPPRRQAEAGAAEGEGSTTRVDPPRNAGPGTRFVVRCRVTPPASDIEAAAELEVVLHEMSDGLRFDGAGSTWSVEVVTTLPGAVVEALSAAGSMSETHVGLADPAL